ncbi:10850_t:CDS:2 [Acaulospora colombiana]|uniref:10850_t:CDS:1 n=1 Tax=Acaulospora colombiana TaxID=27376 RepID=A0ACA9KXV6_9GLOM|nr:10850_t:CDS:2 [Acaulospora colombiana]
MRCGDPTFSPVGEERLSRVDYVYFGIVVNSYAKQLEKKERDAEIPNPS